MIDVWTLRVGAVVETIEGSRARVKEPSRDGEWVLVEYLVSDDGVASGEDLLSVGEIAAVEMSAV